ncbi:unnamed protein product [Adineta steineri]|uniref:Uncharacterized protein n=1 Tax=Adineta steineri TaxID=433720 RepID=A0A815FHC7_9BILA|nr:unnamed protein product [Adineta steineri]CAF1585874.1 unnamed protein product [Adineta steineri]
MKVSILVVNIVLPMIVSIGLYCYAFLSTHWNFIDNKLIYEYNITNKQQENIPTNNKSIQLESQFVRHAFRSRYSLFGYCLDYKWLNLLAIKSQKNLEDTIQSNSIVSPQSCNDSFIYCQELESCVKKCDNIPDCPSYIDEDGCNRLANQTRYYWKNEKCMWESISLDNHGIPRYIPLNSNSPRDFHYYTKRIRHLIMLLLFVTAPLLTFMALLILFCINCINRFYSIPFAFVSLFSFASFLSGAGGLGIFLYEWIQERSHRPAFTYEFEQTEAFIVALNPWIINVERLGLAFWLTVAAIGASLFTTILSCCFCCALQSDKSKLRIHVDNDKYVIVHTNPYDE